MSNRLSLELLIKYGLIDKDNIPNSLHNKRLLGSNITLHDIAFKVCLKCGSHHKHHTLYPCPEIETKDIEIIEKEEEEEREVINEVKDPIMIKIEARIDELQNKKLTGRLARDVIFQWIKNWNIAGTKLIADTEGSVMVPTSNFKNTGIDMIVADLNNKELLKFKIKVN